MTDDELILALMEINEILDDIAQRYFFDEKEPEGSIHNDQKLF